MNDYIQSLSHDNKKVFYKIRNVVLKIVKSTSAVDFNQNCLREHLCPRNIYIYIYIYILAKNPPYGQDFRAPIEGC